jgi:hypothetical protein
MAWQIRQVLGKNIRETIAARAAAYLVANLLSFYFSIAVRIYSFFCFFLQLSHLHG